MNDDDVAEQLDIYEHKITACLIDTPTTEVVFALAALGRIAASIVAVAEPAERREQMWTEFLRCLNGEYYALANSSHSARVS